MNCPKCNAPNEGKYTFCTECGTVIPQIYDDASDEAATVVKKRDEMATEIMPSPPKPLPTEIYSAPNTARNEALPTQPDVPVTQYVSQEKPLPPTQHYSAPNVERNAPLPRTQVVQPITPPPNQQSSETRLKVEIPQKVEFGNPPQDKFEIPKANKEPKKSLKLLKVAGILLLLLLIGGGVAVYFLAAPMQSSKSYFLTNKLNVATNILEFDNPNKTFLMVGKDNNNFQKWQITPDAGDKNYYRFVNRGLDENMSLEVVDDNTDSSVSMAQTAKDVGQLWAITHVKDDYYRITNKWLGDTKSLSYSKQYFYFLRVRDSNNDDGQLWKKISAPSGKGFYLTNKKYGDTVFLQSLDNPFKDKLAMQSGEAGNRQWNLNDLGTGFYTLTAVADGKGLEVNQSQKDRVIMSATANSAPQRWKMIPVSGDYFRLTNESLGDGKSLEAVTFSAFQMQMVKTSDTDEGQLWKLTQIK